MDNLTFIADLLGSIVDGFTDLWDFLFTTTILDIPVGVLLLGGSLAVYFLWVIAKWILDIAT
jgi:hypothetical protein